MGSTPMMEKKLALERKHSWQWDEDHTASESATFLESICWPCGVYSRTSQRLNAALGGRDAVHIPSEGCCTSDCLQYAACFPFYGVLLAKLQGTVRSFYDIDGNDVSDWLSGCLCPCVTLARNENEILLRERHHHHKPPHTHDDRYEAESPMEAPVEWSSECSPTTVSLENPDGRVLTSIPEGSRETSTARIPSRCISQSEGGPLACADAGGPPVHRLDQDVQMIPVEVAPTHTIHKDPRTQTESPYDTSHDLRRDPTTGHAGPPRTHSIELDQLGPTDGPQPLKHTIHRDQLVARPQPTAQHELPDDTVNSPPQRDRGTTRHELRDDTVTSPTPPPRRDRGTPHGLDDHQPTISKGATHKPHILFDDK